MTTIKNLTFKYNDALESSKKYFDGDELAAKVFIDKYALQNENGEYLEKTPHDMHKRLAKEFARIENSYPNPLTEQEIFNLLDRFRYIIPQGSPMSGIGNPYQIMSISNCFVLDSPKDSYSGILTTDQEQAHIMRRRGGVGFDISKIRPKGMSTKNAAKTTDGISIFMERFSNTCREVAQNGRRGALMLTISCHHPEIRTFINIKKDLTKVTGANISIRLSDEFMNAVKNKEKVNLRWPVDSDNPKISTYEDAESIWNEIIEAAYNSAEPGLLFWDNAIKNTPAQIYKDYGFNHESTNPSLRATTLVTTKNGVFEIKDLVDKSFEVLNIDGVWSQAVCVLSGENKQLTEISFNSNQSVFCTQEHKWPVINTLGNIRNKQTGSISKKKTSLLEKGDNIYFPSFDKPINNPDCHFNNDDGFIVGWNIGDGWQSYHKTQNKQQYGFIFGNEDVECGIADRVINYTNKLAKTKSHLLQDHESNAVKYVTTDSNIINRFTTLGLSNKKLGIPKSVWTGNHEFVTGFIDGLFSADAYVEYKEKLQNCRLVFVTAHAKLAEDIRNLLAIYGIKSCINFSKKSSKFPNKKYNTGKLYERWDVCVSGKNLEKFCLNFKLSNVNKQEKLNKVLLSNKDCYKTDRNYLKIKNIKQTEIYEDVYDITVLDETNTFHTNYGISGNCGEIILSPKDSCRLLLINITSYVDNPFTDKASFNFDLFADHVVKAQRLMDDIVDLEIECIDKILAKIDSDPESEAIKAIDKNLWLGIRKNCVNGRRTGLGITGLGDCLAYLNVKYGSPKSIEITESIYKQLAINSYKSSCIMAGERGPFLVFDKELEKDHPFLDRIWNESPEVHDLYLKYGRRNISNTTTPPAGSTSIEAQVSSGIESVFLLSYIRRKKVNPDSKEIKVDFVDIMGDSWSEYKVYHHGLKKWMEVTGNSNIEDSPYFGATSNDIDWVAGVKLQAAAQKWICHSISRTANVPIETTIDTIKQIYMKAWELGCKGYTIYRAGSRSGVLVEIPKEKKLDRPLKIVSAHAPARPKELPCEIHKATVKGTKWTVVVGLLDGDPYELFMGHADILVVPNKVVYGVMSKTGKGKYKLSFDAGKENESIDDVIKTCNDDESAWATRMISTSLRHGVPVEFLVEQLSKDGSVVDINMVLARILKKYAKNGSVKCPDCGSTQLIFRTACFDCTACGRSGCGV